MMKSSYCLTATIPRVLFACLIAFYFTPQVYSQPSTWTSGGPYVDTDIYSLAMAVTDPDILYAGTPRGVFKSVDSGINWTRTGNLLALTRTVQVDPTDSDVVFAGTDDGIYKSKDGGSTWIQKGLAGVEWVNTITIDPRDPDILYAGTGKPMSYWTGEIVGIFKSSDGGETWQEKLIETDPGQDYDAITSILVDTDNSSTVYAATYNGFLKSTDGGETWVSKEIQGRFRPDYVVALAMTPAGTNPPAIYAIKNFDRAGVYKSQDGGETWADTNIPNIDGSSPWAMAVDPNNPNVIYVGTPDGRFGSYEHLYKSTNGGNSWSLKDSGLPDSRRSTPSSIVIDPRNSDVYVGIEDGGVYKSTDGAGNWNILGNTMDLASIHHLAVHPTLSSTVLAPVNSAGLAKTTDGGGSWDFLPGGRSSGPIAYYPQNPSIIWAGGGTSVSRSTDNGENWTSLRFLNCTPGPCESAASAILIRPENSDHLLVATSSWGGVFARTTDGGQNWSQLGFTTTALAADPNNSDVVYTGKENRAQVFRYNNVWESAGAIEITGETGNVRDMEVDSDSKLYVAGSNGFWTWDGADWERLTGISSDDITALTIDRTITPGILYVGTGEDGVFVSEDGGITWIEFNDGLESLSINVLAVSDGEPKMIYAGTARGLWSTELSTVVASPAAVTLASPSNEADDQPSTVAFSWGTEASATSYHLQVSTSSNFGSFVFEDSTLTTTGADVGPLAYSTEHYWRVRAKNAGGIGPWSEAWSFTVAEGTAVEELEEEVPQSYALHQNYPNPFNPATRIEFALPVSSQVTLKIYDMLGREITTLVNDVLPAGRHSAEWIAVGFPTGVYIYRMVAGRFEESRTLTLME